MFFISGIKFRVHVTVCVHFVFEIMMTIHLKNISFSMCYIIVDYNISLTPAGVDDNMSWLQTELGIFNTGCINIGLSKVHDDLISISDGCSAGVNQNVIAINQDYIHSHILEHMKSKIFI